MKPLFQTYTAGNAGKNPDENAELMMKAIEWRANYVGPVLEEILHEMQEHGWQDQDAETGAAWDLPPAGF